jgi:uncharacterized membrane protein
MTTTMHPLAEEYLRHLERAAQHLPRADRDELLAEIRSHLDSGLPAGATEGQVRNLLAELGAPEDIAAAAAPQRPPTRRGLREIAALLLLLTGLPPVIGWLAGVGLLLWSPLWTPRQKALGILVWPGGYVLVAGASFLLSARSCEDTTVGVAAAQARCTSAGPSGLSIITIIVLLVAPLVVTGYLYRAAGRRSGAM